MITLLALPTVWLVNRNEDGPGSARPNVAAVGLAPGEADDASAGATTEVFDPMGTTGAVYLQRATPAAPSPTVAVAVGTAPGELVGDGRATYHRDVPSGTCRYNGVPGGTRITVVNVANLRVAECTVANMEDAQAGELVMSSGLFATIADLLMAPLHVEIRR